MHTIKSKNIFFVTVFSYLYVLPLAFALPRIPTKKVCEGLDPVNSQIRSKAPPKIWTTRQKRLGDLRAEQQARLEGYNRAPNLRQEVMFDFNPHIRPLYAETFPHMRGLPQNMSLAQREFYEGVFHYLRSHDRPFLNLQKFEYEIVEYAASTGKSMADAQEYVLRKWELEFGFYEPVIVLDNRVYTNEEFAQVIAAGRVFVEIGAENYLIPPHNTQSTRWKHLGNAHRIQLHLVMRELRQHPERFGNQTNFNKFYRDVGHLMSDKKLDWSNTGAEDGPEDRQNLWFHLFDSYENNYSSPGFFFEYHEFWPEISLARP